MNQAPMVYICHDGERCQFTVPKGVNRGLVARALKKIHEGGDPDLVSRGLTEREVRLLLEIIGTLEDHRLPTAV